MILVSDGQNIGQHRVIQASGTSGEEQNHGNEFEIVFIENSTTPAGSTIIDGKTQTIYTTTGNDKTTHFMSPIGSLQLTAEECNEILMKRAVAAVQNQQQQHTITTTTASDQHSTREYLISSERDFDSNYERILQRFPFKSKKCCKHLKIAMTSKVNR